MDALWVPFPAKEELSENISRLQIMHSHNDCLNVKVSLEERLLWSLVEVVLPKLSNEKTRCLYNVPSVLWRFQSHCLKVPQSSPAALVIPPATMFLARDQARVESCDHGI